MPSVARFAAFACWALVLLGGKSGVVASPQASGAPSKPAAAQQPDGNSEAGKQQAAAIRKLIDQLVDVAEGDIAALLRKQRRCCSTARRPAT
jgi:hypothetical protein